MLNFLRNHHTIFYSGYIPFYISTSNIQRFQFLYILDNTCYFLFFFSKIQFFFFLSWLLFQFPRVCSTGPRGTERIHLVTIHNLRKNQWHGQFSMSGNEFMKLRNSCIKKNFKCCQGHIINLGPMTIMALKVEFRAHLYFPRNESIVLSVGLQEGSQSSKTNNLSSSPTLMLSFKK